VRLTIARAVLKWATTRRGWRGWGEGSLVFGEPNRAVLVQQRLVGVEFYINTVSAGGVHRVAET
jgi:hypothetical protein